MSIPQGTKFHGVAPSVDTANKGSATANARRDAIEAEVQQMLEDKKSKVGSVIVSSSLSKFQ